MAYLWLGWSVDDPDEICKRFLETSMRVLYEAMPKSDGEFVL
jgi:hypothetical protein